MPNKYNYHHYYYVNISLCLLFLLFLFSVNARTVSINSCVHIERKKDKSMDTFLICFYCWMDSIADYYAAPPSIMVWLVCVVGLLFEWIMIHWAVTRGTDEQRDISLSVYTSNYPSMLCACWWTGTSKQKWC